MLTARSRLSPQLSWMRRSTSGVTLSPMKLSKVSWSKVTDDDSCLSSGAFCTAAERSGRPPFSGISARTARASSSSLKEGFSCGGELLGFGLKAIGSDDSSARSLKNLRFLAGGSCDGPKSMAGRQHRIVKARAALVVKVRQRPGKGVSGETRLDFSARAGATHPRKGPRDRVCLPQLRPVPAGISGAGVQRPTNLLPS